MTQKSSFFPTTWNNFITYSTYLWCIALGWSVGFSNVMMVICTVGIFIQIVMHRDQFSVRQFIIQPTTFLYFLLCMSLIWSKNLLHGLSELRTYLPLILYTLAIQYWIQNQAIVIMKGIQYLAYSLVIGLCITYAINILPADTVAAFIKPIEGILKPFYSDADISHFGWYVPFMERINYCNLLTYCGLALLFLGKVQNKKRNFLISIFFFGSSFILGARASMIGILVIIPFLLFYLVKGISHKKSIIIFFILSVTIASTVYIALPNVKSRMMQTKYEIESIQDGTYQHKDFEHFTTLSRLVSWRNSWRSFQEKPILGHGIGDYDSNFENQYQNDVLNFPIYYHSQWMYWLGVIGSVGLFLFIFSYLKWGGSLLSHTAKMYFLCFSIYTSITWIFDTLLLQKEEMMAFTLFLSVSLLLQKQISDSIHIKY